MIEFLHHIFGFVCGQPAGRTWSLDGEWLPFCQRCTGIYVGALVAVALQLVFRIRPSSRLLGVYSLLIVQIAPFGLHVVRDTGMLRTLTGMAFSFGLIAFLWLLPQERLGLGCFPKASTLWSYAMLALFAAFSLIFAVNSGGAVTAALLSLVGMLGFSILVLLTLLNVGFLSSSLLKRLRSNPYAFDHHWLIGSLSQVSGFTDSKSPLRDL